MMIDKIKNFGQNPEVKKASPTKGFDSGITNDKIAISSAAKERTEEVKLLSDVKQFTLSALSMEEDANRVQRLGEIKSKLSRGEYDSLSDEIVEKTADKLLETLLEN